MRTYIALLLAMVSISAQSETDIDLLTGFMPPFAYTPIPKLHSEGDELRGHLVDRLRHACDQGQVKCSFTMRHPWKLAVSASARDEKSALFPMIRHAGNEEKYQWVGPIKQQERLLVVTLKGNGLVLRNLNAVNDYKTGMRQSLSEDLKVPHSVHLSMSDHTLWRELKGQKLDLWIVEESVAQYYASQDKVELRTVLAVDERDLWLAVNKKVPQDVIVKLNAELRKTVRDQSLTE